MSEFQFQVEDAIKEQEKLRAIIWGGPGSGKTRTALEIARHLVPNAGILVVDTEGRSARKFEQFVKPYCRFFKVIEMADDYNPRKFPALIKHAHEVVGADVLIVDSGTAFWDRPGGFLDMVDQDVKRQKASSQSGKGDSFNAWRNVDPVYKDFVTAFQHAPLHVIFNLRAKVEHEKVDGKVKKLGMQPQFRDGFVYEGDLEASIDEEHTLLVRKTRCDALDGKCWTKAGKEMADILRDWLASGAAATPQRQVAVPWRDRIAAADTPAALDALAKDLAKEFPTGHPERSDVGGAISRRKAELAPKPEAQPS